MRARYFLDHDVDYAVARALRRAGYECWTAGEAGLHAASDDQLTVYAHDRRAALVTHDREFSRRRRMNVVGTHIWLRCLEWEAESLVLGYLPAIDALVRSYVDIYIAVSADGLEISHRWD